ncbi:MAG: OmpA family protein [Deltaproteobacteria bacterium]|nr:OmpA family protein [Deltaproteobacteria bacterium]
MKKRFQKFLLRSLRRVYESLSEAFVFEPFFLDAIYPDGGLEVKKMKKMLFAVLVGVFILSSWVVLAEDRKLITSKYRFEIAGHTDSIGSEGFNLNLSQQRAKVIKKYLFEKYDISAKKLEVKGYGESMPVGSNDTETGRAKNRRVVFKRLD